eukprot:4341427-Alexandrium_andersonii.AAC.1
MLAIRSLAPGDTHDIEGISSILQKMCKLAPTMGLALASARISLKKSEPLTPSVCTPMHGRVVAYMESD